MSAFICYSGAEWGGGPFYQEKPKENNNSRHKSKEESQAQEKICLFQALHEPKWVLYHLQRYCPPPSPRK